MSDPTLARGYRAGAWFGILGDHAIVVLPPSEKHRVGTLWELVDTGAGFDEVLDALISGGLRELPGFVLVSEFEADTKVVVRGSATATFTTADGEVVLAGSEGTTWVERTMSGVTAMAIDVSAEGHAGPTEFVVGNGLVRVSRIEEPPAVAARPPAPAEPVAPEAPSREPWPASPETEAFGVAAPLVPAGADDVSGGDLEEDADDTADHPIAMPVDPAAPDPDHDGLTQVGVLDPDAVPPPPGIPGQPPAPDVTSRPVARLVLPEGETVEVDRAILVGRAPEARRFPTSEQPRLVTVPSPHSEISSTHLEVRPGSGADHGSAVVTDLGSTNGTVLVQPGLGPQDLQPGVAVQLVPGAVLDLGDGVTIEVVQP